MSLPKYYENDPHDRQYPQLKQSLPLPVFAFSPLVQTEKFAANFQNDYVYRLYDKGG
ncbi:hypothetical protein S3E15_01032 [Bacillus mycoides]|uniref:Uncharacterized protein n=1 Tax=Bacillus mycoides TaxID=1405 RepID=A0AAP7W6K4_BACMY|nr:hypothetical protein S3E15_01032 [Bacillus mycoides]OSY12439.1 hypothetical protein BTJ48_05980 [Bacillus mycoides]OSY14015.1 hypothetical protein BTJ44_01431 [Bacillus mycoides]